jgi:uncharacterized protein (DUF2235 family)
MPQKIVLCADGTWNKPNQKDEGVASPTNVVKIMAGVGALDAEGNPQKAFYDKGVGTGGFWDKILGGAFGHGLSQNIIDLYTRLVEMHEPGDDIYIFGFSRGAYTARSLAGLIRNSGILHREHAHRVKEAFDLYRSRDEKSKPSGEAAELFRKQYSKETRIKCVGVWDTVGALGVPLNGLRFVNRFLNVRFHDVTLSRAVDNAFHALAIDEKRGAFVPCVWKQQADAEGQVLEQAWFPGAHSNVGGGYKKTGLSDTAFQWMREKAESCGLAFDHGKLEPYRIEPKPDCDLVDSRTAIYKLVPGYDRPLVQDPLGRENIHPVVLQRLEKVSAYRPRNLISYLKIAGVPLPQDSRERLA